MWIDIDGGSNQSFKSYWLQYLNVVNPMPQTIKFPASTIELLDGGSIVTAWLFGF
jgi:hypothetical protein